MLGLGINRSSSQEPSVVARGGASYLLDDYSGAAAAYSLRQLSSSYSGDAIKVRRSSDNSEADIRFVNGELDTTGLANHCGSSDGFVSVWYDQSSNTNDATQSTAARQPKIYDGTTGVVTENGKPAVKFLSGHVLNKTSTTPTTIFAVAKIDTFDAINYLLYDSTGGYPLGGTYPGINGLGIVQTSGLIISSITGEDLNTHLGVWYYDGSKYQVAKDGESLQDLTNTNNIPVTSISRDITSSARLLGSVHEIVLYTSDETANRTNIEDNINTFYSIY